jgi:predicted nucleic acid-binding protein
VVNLVLDASAGFELLVDSELGAAIQRKLPSAATWWVPEHYFVETASVLRRAEMAGALNRGEAGDALDRLRRSRLSRVAVRPLLAAAWTRRANLTIADALYVVLADQLDATLVTGDLRLAAAPGLPVPTITP